MIEQYVYDRITEDETLQTLLSAGSDGLHLYPTVVPRGIDADRIVTFTLITTGDAFPTIQSRNVQFNIFTKTHMDGATIAAALANLFQEDHLHTEGGVKVVFSQRVSESDLGYNFDDTVYQREATYSFRIR